MMYTVYVYTRTLYMCRYNIWAMWNSSNKRPLLLLRTLMTLAQSCAAICLNMYRRALCMTVVHFPILLLLKQSLISFFIAHHYVLYMTLHSTMASSRSLWHWSWDKTLSASMRSGSVLNLTSSGCIYNKYIQIHILIHVCAHILWYWMHYGRGVYSYHPYIESLLIPHYRVYAYTCIYMYISLWVLSIPQSNPASSIRLISACSLEENPWSLCPTVNVGYTTHTHNVLLGMWCNLHSHVHIYNVMYMYIHVDAYIHMHVYIYSVHVCCNLYIVTGPSFLCRQSHQLCVILASLVCILLLPKLL